MISEGNVLNLDLLGLIVQGSLAIRFLLASIPFFHLTGLYFFKYKFIYFNWRLITLQYCIGFAISSVQFSSVTQSCPTLCNPMNRSTPGLAVHHQLPEFTQTHVHRVSDAIQPSHPLSSPSPPAPNPSQHQSLFQ